MRGSPLLIAGLTLGFFVLLLVPLRHLTDARTPTGTTAALAAPAPSEAAPGPAGAGSSSAVRLEIVSTRAPFRFEVRHLGEVIWTGELADGGAGRSGREVPMEFPAEGVDLQLRGRWTLTEGTPSPPLSAVRLTVVTPDGTVREKTVMAETAAVDETLTFP